MHKTAFIVTDVRLTTPDDKPTASMLRRAVGHAILAAWHAQKEGQQTNFEGFSIGSRQYKFIKGQFLTNQEQFGHLDHDEWPETKYHVMSESKGPHTEETSDGEVFAAVARIPMEILDNCWNTAHNLVSLALQNSAAHGAGHPNRGLIYPDILLNTDRILAHSLHHPDVNALGETDQQFMTGESRRANRYLPHEEASQAHFLAMGPLYRLERAQFELDYVQEISKYNNHIVLEADWNM